MTDYEKARQKRIQENSSKMKAFRIPSMAYEMQLRMGSKKTSNCRMQSKKAVEVTDEYTPCDEEYWSEDDNVNDIRQNDLNLRFAVRRYQQLKLSSVIPNSKKVQVGCRKRTKIMIVTIR